MKLPFDIDSTTAFVVTLSSAVAALEKFFQPVRKGYYMVKAFLKRRRENSIPSQLSKLHSAVSTLSEKVDSIQYQVKHNSGLSMRDDISAIKLEVQELVASNAINREMMEEGLFRCSSDGKNYLVNRAYANMLGVTIEQLLGMEWHRWLDDNQYDVTWKSAFDLGSSLDTETCFKDIDGNRIKVRVKMFRYLDGYEGRIKQIKE